MNNFFVEQSEETAMEGTNHKPLCRFRYVDDKFVIWPSRTIKLSEFLDHLNSMHEIIQFTTETKPNGHLPFFDIDIYRKPDRPLGRKVYCKPTHTNVYLSCNSHRHLSDTLAVVSTPVDGARSCVTSAACTANCSF
jgi:hypothetical protein